MNIRFAREDDIPRINDLLSQVCMVHHIGRPDIFNIGRKYNDDQLRGIISDDSRPILIAADENDIAQGYAFCIMQSHRNDNILTDITTLYIDDLCVDETLRGQGIGRELYDAALDLARQRGCYNVTLNVWQCNESAMGFYRACGMSVMKTCMETIL